MACPARCFFSTLVFGALVSAVASPAGAKPARPFIMNSERLNELTQVNRHVNGTIIEMSDMEQYGQEDVWALPVSGKGDCEDFALLKRQLLAQRGWPSSALSIAVGATSSGEAHAVLIVKTPTGELVLDNLTSAIRPPEHSGLVLHSRQSGKGWKSATGERTSMPEIDLPPARRGSFSAFRARRG